MTDQLDSRAGAGAISKSLQHRACDQCAIRKVKCSNNCPCSNCIGLSIQCTYINVPRKKGRKRKHFVTELTGDTDPSSAHLASILSALKNDRLGSLSNESLCAACEPYLRYFFESLCHVIPVFRQDLLLAHMRQSSPASNPSFWSMIFALCAFTLIQPTGVDNRMQSDAETLLNKSLMLRSSFSFAQDCSACDVLASFFMFGCLFGLGMSSAAHYRLVDAINLAERMDLTDRSNESQVDELEYIVTEQVIVVLFITYKAWALQVRHSFRDIQSGQKPHYSLLRPNFSLSILSITGQDDGLWILSRIFDTIDDDFLMCWSGQCSNKSDACDAFTSRRAIAIYDRLSNYHDVAKDKMERLAEAQFADIVVTIHWLRNKVWQLCLSHRLLKLHSSQPKMTLEFSLAVAEQCLHDVSVLSIESLDVHGLGILEKLYDVSGTLLDFGMTQTEVQSSDFREKVRLTLQAYAMIMRRFRGGEHLYYRSFHRSFMEAFGQAAFADHDE